jgi:hypothetical protein
MFRNTIKDWNFYFCDDTEKLHENKFSYWSAEKNPVGQLIALDRLLPEWRSGQVVCLNIVQRDNFYPLRLSILNSFGVRFVDLFLLSLSSLFRVDIYIYTYVGYILIFVFD